VFVGSRGKQLLSDLVEGSRGPRSLSPDVHPTDLERTVVGTWSARVHVHPY
jgi:hypothetical protein